MNAATNHEGSYPTHGTQATRMLASLLVGQRINPLAGWLNLGIYRLSDTAFQLRGLGWPVVTGKLDVRNRFGEPCRVAEYRLEQEDIDAAGPSASEFIDRENELREAA